jgi:nucleoside 2-deoxyribosyltransferase
MREFLLPLGIPGNWDIGRVPAFLLEMGARRSDQEQGRGLLKKYLSIYSRECEESGRRAEFPVPFNLPQMERLAETYAHTPIPDRADRLLRLLARRTNYPGGTVEVNAYFDYPAAHAIEPQEFDYYLEYLARAALIERPAGLDTKISGQTPDVEYGRETVVTIEGWRRVSLTGAATRAAFVAMCFAPELEKAFDEGIAPGIADAGYDPVRVDKVEHNEKVCDRIVAEIRRSRILVADVTMQRQGVYFEAGFAMALGMPVIWMCRKDDLANVHFDTRQYNHIVWETPADLRIRLRDRILATVR